MFTHLYKSKINIYRMILVYTDFLFIFFCVFKVNIVWNDFPNKCMDAPKPIHNPYKCPHFYFLA